MPALAQAAAMPLLEENTPQEHPPTVPVVIIGESSIAVHSAHLVQYFTLTLVPLDPQFSQTGFDFRQWPIRNLSVLPAQWIQALLRSNYCSPKPCTIQEAAGNEAPSSH